MTIATGTRLGQYEVQDFLGQGAMGVVFRAYHAQLERTGAVKVLQGISPDRATVARFRHEAQAIARLRHPNIVDVHDFGEFQGTPYMIVEYVPGGSLATRMAQGRLDAATALKYLRGIAAGLDYAHSHGVVHRDVKPANVLLTAEDTPVLADFGLAKLVEGTSLKSMTGVTTGTPAYMAPEQVTGHDVGPAADRYSLATIAYEMLTGVIPFDGQGLMEVLYAQVHREAPAPSSRHAALNGEVDRVILRGLAKDPAERWPTATEFVDALERALSDGAATWPTLARTVVLDPPAAPLPPTAAIARPKPRTAPATVAMAFPGVPASPEPARPAQKHTRRRLGIGLAALLVLLLLMGVCAMVAQATTLTVSPDRVAPGGTVHVTATKVPANQAGEIQLHSVVHTYPFRADAGGQVSLDIDIPVDTELGDHVVKICWDNTCHKDALLKVVSGGGPPGTPSASASPSPGASAAPSTSPKPGSTPTPRTTATPRSTPTSTPRTTSTPKSSPSPKPTPSPSPSPTPSCSPQLSVPSISKLNGFTATFKCFPIGTWNVYVVQSGNDSLAGTETISAPGSTYSKHFDTPTLVLTGSAKVKACLGSTCYFSATIDVGL